MTLEDNGWDASAAAWIADMGEAGDRGRVYVLDQPMLARLRAAGTGQLLDIGCGEGRFCRMARAEGFTTTGIDPTRALIARARELDPTGAYIEAVAEDLPLEDGAFDLVVFYLSLIDIPDLRAAINEAARVLRPGGRLLVANLSGFLTAARHDGFQRQPDQTAMIHMRDYLHEDAYPTHWRGIRIKNWHRPAHIYMQAFLKAGLVLTHYDEPASTHPNPAERARYDHVAYFTVMEWQKPG